MMVDDANKIEDNDDLIVEIEGSESQQKTSPVTTEASALSSPDVVVDVVDDTPDADKKHRRREPGAEPEIPSDEEIASYSEGVQKRIKKLKFEYHEERRAKEEMQRQLDEAVRFAQQAMSKHEDLRTRYTKGEQVLVNEAKGRVESDLARARQAYKLAFEAGDSEKLAEAQELIASLAAEKRDISTYRPQTPPPLQPMAPPPPMPDARTRDWASKNSWFMQDRDMTNYALVVDERLKRSGVDPRSDEYFKALDGALRKEFPNRFNSDTPDPSDAAVSQPRKQSTVVAPSSRTVAAPRNKITLTKSQVDLARRLGITPEGYAKQLLALKGKE